MALAALSGDEQRFIFVQLRNPLDPGVTDKFDEWKKQESSAAELFNSCLYTRRSCRARSV